VSQVGEHEADAEIVLVGLLLQKIDGAEIKRLDFGRGFGQISEAGHNELQSWRHANAVNRDPVTP
jgi:hypothetical protein